MTRLIVILSGDAAQGTADRIAAAVAPNRLSPLYPGVKDPQLARTLRVEGDGPHAPDDRLAQELLALPGVDGAYLEPPAGPAAS